MGHDQGADKSQDAEQSLDEALPGLDHGAFGGSFAVIGIQHEASGPARGEFPGRHYPDAFGPRLVGYGGSGAKVTERQYSVLNIQ